MKAFKMVRPPAALTLLATPHAPKLIGSSLLIDPSFTLHVSSDIHSDPAYHATGVRAVT